MPDSQTRQILGRLRQFVAMALRLIGVVMALAAVALLARRFMIERGNDSETRLLAAALVAVTAALMLDWWRSRKRQR